MSIDVYVGDDATLRSLHGRPSINLATPLGGGLLWTQAEADVWDTRADSSWQIGETNDPDLWAEILTRRTTHLADPTANLYPGPTVFIGGEVSHAASLDNSPDNTQDEAAITCMAAAFYARVKPEAGDAQDVIDGVVARIVAQFDIATHPSLDASYSGPWAREGATNVVVDDLPPTYTVARHWLCLMRAIDYVGLDAFTAGQKDQIAEFLYWWAELGAYSLQRKLGAQISGRLSGNYAWTGTLNYDWSPFTSGPVAVNAVRWMNNRRALINAMSALAAEIVNRAGWATPVGEMSIETLRTRSEIHVKEAVTQGVYTQSSDPSASGKAGFAFDFDRGSNAMWYPVATIACHILVADLAARRGDTALYDWTTRAGTPDGAGSNRGSVCRAGDPDKSLLLAALLISRHYAGIYTKSNSAGAINGSTRVHDAAAFPVMNLYHGDAELRANYLPSVSRGSIYAASPGSSGGFRPWYYGWAVGIDGPFLAHDIGVSPY